MKYRILDMLKQPAATSHEASAPAADANRSAWGHWRDVGSAVAEHVRRAPAVSLGTALACGIVVGWLIKRG